MNRKEVRIALTAIIFLLSVWQFIEVNIGNGILLLLLAGFVVLTVFKNETILLALYHLRKQNIPKAEKILKRIKNPQHLLKSQEAYYYMLNGILTAQTQSPIKSEKFFLKALSTGLRLKEDQAVAKLNLAGVAASKRKKREAINYLNQAKKLDTRKLLSDQIKTMQSQMGRI
jgi:uncharacterized membrane protein YraQ (UPF0718 family)